MTVTKPYPFPGSYALAQINLDASLESVQDEEIRAAAREICPAKCVVLLNMVRHCFSSVMVF